MNLGAFRIIVVAIIENDENEVLLVRRAKPPGLNLWALPGGSVEFGEDSHIAISREIREEIGLDFTPQYSFNFDDFTSVAGFHSLVACSFGVCCGAVTINTKEVNAVRFCSLEEISTSAEIAFCHRDLVRRYFDIKGSEPVWTFSPYHDLRKLSLAAS